jgi:PhzF family phenazine biosynthesis protein
MNLPFYWIDAFSDKRFHGNPAAVILAPTELDGAMMQAIATENNLAETAFVMTSRTPHPIRWYTPTAEIDLCGHATLASAFALFDRGLSAKHAIEFVSASGPLRVSRSAELLALDFPARPTSPSPDLTELVSAALGAVPREVRSANATMAVFSTEEEILALRPHMDQVARLPGYGLVVTAPGEATDFVSRFFAPQVGVPEDPVTGSTHCSLIPYWSARFGKTKLHAKQLSARGGSLWCEDHGERVSIAGHCTLYLRGEIHV